MQPSDPTPGGGFGKRGRVTLTSDNRASLPAQRSSLWRWAAGGIAAIFMLALVTGASGGSGLLGGLLAGLVGHQLAKKITGSTTTAATAPRGAAPTATTPGSVARGGFGSTGGSGGFFSGS